MRTIHSFKAIAGACLVGGTAIGAGMLGLPVATGAAGFLPAATLYLLCWLFSAGTALLLFEICLWMPKDANLISMAHHLLGPVGKGIAWALYLFLFYCLTIGYLSKGGGFFSLMSGNTLPHSVCVIFFTLIFGGVVYIGADMVNRVNLLLMVGLIVSYLSFIGLGIDKIQWSFLHRTNWSASFLGLPIIFASFSFQGIIPSLSSYLKQNAKLVRFSIIFGSFLPFLVYLIWQVLIIGIIPFSGENGLQAALLHDKTAVEPLRFLLPESPIYWIGEFFALFALTTSFLGVTLGLFDFLADGLQMQKEGWHRRGIWGMIYVPSTIIAILFPSIFFTALGYAGGVGCALLLGLLPITMVWIGRYHKGYSALHCQLGGGKKTLLLLAAFVVLELVIEGMREIG